MTTHKFAFMLLFGLLCASLISCEDYQQKLEEERIKQQLVQDRLIELEEEEKLINGAYTDALATLQEIDQTLLDIQERNRSMQSLMQQKDMSNNSTQQQLLIEQLSALKAAQLVDANKAKRLTAQARKYRVENASIQKMITKAEEKLRKTSLALSEAQQHITQLEIALKQLQVGIDSTNSELATAYADLKVQTNQLERTNETLAKSLNELKYKEAFIEDDALAYLVCGNRKDLRQAKILRLLSDKRLSQNFQQVVQEQGTSMNFFEDSIIACSGANILRILPSRDTASYQIIDNQIQIRNKKSFWSNFKTLVVLQK